MIANPRYRDKRGLILDPFALLWCKIIFYTGHKTGLISSKKVSITIVT